MIRMLTLMRAGLMALFTVAVVAGCDSSPTAPSSVVAVGLWGGDHLNMTVTATSTHLEFDCAHADIAGPLTLDANGAFSAAGTFVTEFGPIRLGDPPEPQAAMYFGTVSSETMRLSGRLTATNQTIGSFTLTRGTSGRLLKCL